MPLNPHSLTFSGFHSRRSELDQRFEKIRNDSRATVCNPQPFPDFVSFPVIARIEEIDRVAEIM